MTEYICGVKMQGESAQDVADQLGTIDGFFNMMANTDIISCQSTDVIDADIAGISYFFLAIVFIVFGYFLGRHGKKNRNN